MAGMGDKSLSTVLLMIVLGSSFMTAGANVSGHFEGTPGAGERAPAPAQSFLKRSSVEFALNRSLQEAFSRVVGEEAKGQSILTRIEGSIWQTFQSMPKNTNGRLAPRAVRYIVHSYFAKEHGWLIHGLEANGRELDATEVHKVQILQDRAPALVEALLGERQHARGLGLSEVIAMIGTLEQLILDESIRLLNLAYSLNGMSTADYLNMGDLYEVLMSYLWLYESGMQEGLTQEVHQQLKQMVHDVNPKAWQALKVFADDTMRNFNWARRDQSNPFYEYRHSFDDVVTMVSGMAARYGKWQNADCRVMREELMNLDAEGYGTVSLKDFYSQPEDGGYAFEESLEYLQSIGALDESLPNNPRVRIANYVTGPSNCIAQQTYYAVCCLNECESLMNELETRIQGPVASAARLLTLVRHLWTSTVDAPRELSDQLVTKLHQIAANNKGEVPLHGRLFAQWMHYAFPYECPFPQSAANATVLTTDHWGERRHAASSEERQRLISSNTCSKENATGCFQVEHMSLWSDHEVLPFVEQPGIRLANMARIAALVAGILAMVRVAFAAWRGTGACVATEKQAGDQVLSVYV